LHLRGSWRAKTRTREPQPPAAKVVRPAWLDDEQAAAWDSLAPLLQKMGVLTVVDVEAFARYCVLYTRWRKAEAFLKQYGETYPVKNAAGQVEAFKMFPQVRIATALSEQLLKLELQFGLTPSARARLAMILAGEYIPEDNELLPDQKTKKPKVKSRLFSLG
jgi:P27 family predicted phage terminase small subunit